MSSMSEIWRGREILALMSEVSFVCLVCDVEGMMAEGRGFHHWGALGWMDLGEISALVREGIQPCLYCG